MVNLASDKERESRSESLLEKHRSLPGRIDLTPERRHPEVVLGSNSSSGLPSSTSKDDVEVGSNIDLVAQLLVVGRGDDTRHLGLKSGRPLMESRRARGRGERISGDEGGGPLGEERLRRLRDLGRRSLGDVLDTKRETRVHSSEEGGDVNAGTVSEGGVDGLDVDSLSW